SSGRGVRDTCALWAALPELIAPFTAPFGFPLKQRIDSCHVDEPVLTQIRGLATYDVPKIDVLVSTTFRSVPGTFTSLTNTGTTGSNGFRRTAVKTPAAGLVACGSGPGQSETLTTADCLPAPELGRAPRRDTDFRAAKILQ